MADQVTDGAAGRAQAGTGPVERREVHNEPAAFRGFVVVPEGRMFAVFEDPEAGERAIAELGRNGFASGGDLWVFEGAEGARRIDLSGSEHGLGGRLYRVLEHLLSDEWAYLAALDEALRGGALVVSIHVSDEDAERAGHVLAGNGGRPLFAYLRHSFFPVSD